MYDDLHTDGNKVNLPDGKATVEQSHYATPSGIQTSLSEYASPLPPPPTLDDYADIETANSFDLSSQGAVGGVYEEVGDITGKKTPNQWVQFHDEVKEKAPITDFVTPQYTDPYDLSYPPSYRSSQPSTIQGVSLADLKGAVGSEVVLPDVYGDLDGTATTPRLSSSMDSDHGIYQNNNITSEPTSGISFIDVHHSVDDNTEA